MLTPLQLLELVDQHTLDTTNQDQRTYLGASELGESCLRKLFYKFRFCGHEYFQPRMLRLFDRGNREEAVFVQLLRGAGCTIHTPYNDYIDGREDFRFRDCSSHLCGTCDGVGTHPGIPEPFLLEFKTVKSETKDKPGPAFDALARQGVKEANYKHYVQCQIYQGQLGLNLALYCAVNKNDDRLHFEFVRFDRLFFEAQLSRAETIINATATNPPERISSDPSTFTCRYCIYNKICHDNQPIPTAHTHCRNCIHASPAAAGTWECGAGHTFGTLCGDYRGITGPA